MSESDTPEEKRAIVKSSQAVLKAKYAAKAEAVRKMELAADQKKQAAGKAQRSAKRKAAWVQQVEAKRARFNGVIQTDSEAEFVVGPEPNFGSEDETMVDA